MRCLTALGVVAGRLALLVLNPPLHGQSGKRTVLMVTDRALSNIESDAAMIDSTEAAIAALNKALTLTRTSNDGWRAWIVQVLLNRRRYGAPDVTVSVTISSAKKTTVP